MLNPGGKYISVDDGSPKAARADMEFINELVKDRKLKAVIDSTYAFEEIVEAHSYVDKGHKRGNVVLRVRMIRLR